MKKVLVFKSDTEKNAPQICKKLNEIGQVHLTIDLDNLGDTSISISEDGENASGKISVGNQEVDLQDIKSVLCGRLPSPGTLGEDMTERFVYDEFLQSFWSLSTTLGCFWMNPPLTSKFLLDHNKLYQAICAQKKGLLVPKTLISNDPDEIVSFCQSVGGEVALKTVRSRMFNIGDGKSEAIYTHHFTTETLIGQANSIRLAPIMVQEYIKKKLELRVTVVNGELFVCAIHSQNSAKTKHDWRHYDFENVKHEKYQLPLIVEQQILALVDSWDLKYAAIDMILNPDDQFYFLEINPNGQFGWIEALTGIPITLKIAEALAKAE